MSERVSTGSSVSTVNEDAPRNIGAEGNYAFLVHSQDTLSISNVCAMDTDGLAKQKRRRTSPEDQAILEAEYEKNPKPDKAARLDIVNRVTLREKEVQIWFQNRRQVTRRKSRPLLPHELLANLRPSAQAPINAPSSSFSIGNSSQSIEDSPPSSIESSRGSLDFARTNSSLDPSQALEDRKQITPLGGTLSSQMTQRSTLAEEQKTSGPNGNVNGCDQNQVAVDVARCGTLFRSLSQSIPKKSRAHLGHTRRSNSFHIHDDLCKESLSTGVGSHSRVPNSSESKARAPQPLQRTPSLMRLSMSLDGKACVTSGSGTTPSPPRIKTTPDPAVTESSSGTQKNSDVTNESREVTADSLPLPFPNRPAVGRSRDARTWEFYCDKEARDALTEQAEREESGSAIAAIALIKSSSQNIRALTANANKRIAQSQKDEAAKRHKAGNGLHERPKFGRSKSSFPNMQAGGGTDWKANQRKDRNKFRKSGSQSDIFEIYEGDSDKENWMPGTQRSNPPRRQPPGLAGYRPILGEHLRHSSSLSALKNGSKTLRRSASLIVSAKQDSKENRAILSNEEAPSPWLGNSDPREADDLDAVQNLLSLSQGAWR